MKNGTKRMLTVLAGLAMFAGAEAQELSPRAYWPAPNGTRVLNTGYSYSTGDVLMDPSIPIYGVDSSINTAFLAYMHVFSMWNRTSSVLIELPYSWGTTRGLVNKEPGRRDFSGLNDMAVTFSANLMGAPTMDVQEFQKFRADPKPIIAASIKVYAPTGDYNSDRIINVGGNRWVAKAELAWMWAFAEKWLLEIELGAVKFGDDPDYIGGYREQQGLLTSEVHIVRRFAAGFWASIEANFFTGGRQVIGGDELGDLQRNVRMGASIAIPLKNNQAIRFGASTGVVTHFGADSRQFLMSYNWIF